MATLVTPRIRFRPVPGRATLPLPSYGSELAAGLDVPAAEAVTLAPGEWTSVGTGLEMELEPGFEAQLRPRSGLAARHGVTVLNAPGTLDADFRGEVRVLLINHGRLPYRIEVGDRIAQMVVAPAARAEIELVTSLGPTGRGSGGFGHTGR